jgi:hypothetical protein
MAFLINAVRRAFTGAMGGVDTTPDTNYFSMPNGDWFTLPNGNWFQAP